MANLQHRVSFVEDDLIASQIPFCRCLFTFQNGGIKDNAVAVIGVPYDSGNPYKAGAREAPASLRRCWRRLSVSSSPDQCDVIELIRSSQPKRVGHNLQFAWDWGDIRVEQPSQFSDLSRRISRVCQQLARNRAVPVFIGGDHSISLATISALQAKAPLAVLWLDAHNDTGECLSETVDHGNVARSIVQLPNVVEMVQMGIRGYRVDEKINLPTKKLKILTMDHIHGLSPRGLQEEFSKHPFWYVSLDVDVIDPSVAPATSTPVSGGFTLNELATILDALAESAYVAGLDIVELNPSIDPDDLTAASVLQLLLQ